MAPVVVAAAGNAASEAAASAHHLEQDAAGGAGTAGASAVGVVVEDIAVADIVAVAAGPDIAVVKALVAAELAVALGRRLWQEHRYRQGREEAVLERWRRKVEVPGSGDG